MYIVCFNIDSTYLDLRIKVSELPSPFLGYGDNDFIDFNKKSFVASVFKNPFDIIIERKPFCFQEAIKTIENNLNVNVENIILLEYDINSDAQDAINFLYDKIGRRFNKSIYVIDEGNVYLGC